MTLTFDTMSARRIFFREMDKLGGLEIPSRSGSIKGAPMGVWDKAPKSRRLF